MWGLAGLGFQGKGIGRMRSDEFMVYSRDSSGMGRCDILTLEQAHLVKTGKKLPPGPCCVNPKHRSTNHPNEQRLLVH